MFLCRFVLFWCHLFGSVPIRHVADNMEHTSSVRLVLSIKWHLIHGSPTVVVLLAQAGVYGVRKPVAFASWDPTVSSTKCGLIPGAGSS